MKKNLLKIKYKNLFRKIKNNKDIIKSLNFYKILLKLIDKRVFGRKTFNKRKKVFLFFKKSVLS